MRRLQTVTGAQGTRRAELRQNRRCEILNYFAARLGQHISSAELHRLFGSAFRTRVSEINRDPGAALQISNETGTGVGGEISLYWAEPRGRGQSAEAVELRSQTGRRAGVARGIGQRRGRSGDYGRGRSDRHSVDDNPDAELPEAEEGGLREEEAAPPTAPIYAAVRMDLAHQLAAHRKFAEHPFVVNGQGEVLCPVCKVGMLRGEERENLAPHFVCPRTGLVFYGDPESLYLCLSPSLDVAGLLCPAAT